MDAIDVAVVLIHRWEGLRLTAYPDPVSGGEPWTIGWGATGPDITEGTVWTLAQAEQDLKDRLVPLANTLMGFLTKPMNANQLGALIDLAYNVGWPRVSTSTLLALWNQGVVQGAADQFLVWNRAGGQVVQGLNNRRADERRVFLGGQP